MTIKAKCPKCGTDCESKQVWQMTSPRSQSVLTVYQLKCPTSNVDTASGSTVKLVKCQNCQELKKIEAKEESARFIAKTLDTQLYYCKAKSQLLAEDDVIDNLPCKDYKPKEIVCVKMSLCARGE